MPQPANPEIVQQRFENGFYRPNFWLHVSFLLAASSVLLLSVLMRSEGETLVYAPGMILPMPETCTGKVLFGINCPGCGMTRAFISMSSGNFSRAWHFNPASFVLYPFIAFQIPWNLLQLNRLRQRIVPFRSNWFFAAPILIAVSLVIQWLIRLAL